MKVEVPIAIGRRIGGSEHLGGIVFGGGVYLPLLFCWGGGLGGAFWCV